MGQIEIINYLLFLFMSIKVHQHDLPQIALFAKLQTTVSTLKSLHQKSAEEHTDNNVLEEIALAKINSKHQLQIQALKDQLDSRNNYVKELELQQKSQESTLMTNFKFQLNRLEQMVCEREVQNESLHKQLLKQKQKITQMQSQLESERQERQFYENSFKKLIQTVKIQLREINSTNDENELTRFMSLTTYKQLIERMEVVGGLGIQHDVKKNCMRERYMRLRNEHLRLVERNNWLELEKERLGQRLWGIENGYGGAGKPSLASKGKEELYANSSLQQIRQSTMSKSLISFQTNQLPPTFAFPFNLTNPSHIFPPSAPHLPNLPQTILFQRLQQTLDLISSHSNQLQGINQNLNQISKKITEQQQTWSQIMLVKQVNTKLKDDLNELIERKVNPLVSDELMQTNHPTLYSFFTMKMQQLQQFESRLQSLQTQSSHIIQLIQRIFYQGLPIRNQLQPTSKQLHQQQSLLRSKLKKELLSKFQSEKQIIKQQIQSFYESKITALNQQINKLTKEASRLSVKNEDMFKLLNQMEQREQQMLQQVEDNHNQEVIMKSTNQKSPTQQEQQQIQSKIPSSKKSQIDKQLLDYLQKKTDDLQVLLQEERKLSQRYKKELKFIIQNYRIKSTKLKVCRCNECLLTITDEKTQGKKCEKCKLDLHLDRCYKQHENNCKRHQTARGNMINNSSNMKTTKNNAAQKKKASNQLGNSIVSQNMDYF